MSLELIASVGLMWILKHGSILNKPRSFITEYSQTLRELFKCSLCLGFWSGVAIAGFYYNYIDTDIRIILLPLASAGLSWLFDSLLDLIQLASCKLDK